MMRRVHLRLSASAAGGLRVVAVLGFVLGGAPAHARAADLADAPAVESVTLATTQPMPVAAVAPEMQGLALLLEKGLGRVPEGVLLRAAVTTAPGPLRLTPGESAALARGFQQAYAAMAADPAFAHLPSALPQVLSQDARRPGQYFLYRPARVSPDTPMVVFLHGFGGNLQFYPWVLKSAFADDVIVCPSWGVAWGRQGEAFLEDVLADVARRLGVRAAQPPWLIATSAGGPAAFAIYNAAPARFAGLILLATRPDAGDVAAARADLNVLMINGVKDDRFPIDHVRRTAGACGRAWPAWRSGNCPGRTTSFC